MSGFYDRWDERPMSWDELQFLPENTWQIGMVRPETWDERRMFWDERHIYSGFSSLLPRIHSVSPRIHLVSPLCFLESSSLLPRDPGKQREPKEEEVRYHQGSIEAKHQSCLTFSLNCSTKMGGSKISGGIIGVHCSYRYFFYIVSITFMKNVSSNMLKPFFCLSKQSIEKY